MWIIKKSAGIGETDKPDPVDEDGITDKCRVEEG